MQFPDPELAPFLTLTNYSFILVLAMHSRPPFSSTVKPWKLWKILLRTNLVSDGTY